MKKHRAWLLSEIEGWTREGVIDARQAERLRARYPEEDVSPWGLIVFCSLGAVVLGLGVVLLIAYNWSEIPRLGKLALVLGSIAGAHGAGIWLLGHIDWRRRVGEALLLLGTTLYGSGIWLVAQAYHIDEHFPNGFLLWALGALALGWAARSIPQIMAACVLLAIWDGAETIAFDQSHLAALLLILIGAIPFVWRLRSALTLAVALAAFAFVTITNAAAWNGSAAAFTTAFAFSVLLIGAARWPTIADAFPLGSRVASFFGLVGFLLCSFLLSFKEIARSLMRWETRTDLSSLVVYGWSVFALALAIWIAHLVFTVRLHRRSLPLELWLCPIALIYCQILAVAGFYHDREFVAGVFNCVFLAVALMWMVRGCREGHLTSAVLGCVLFSAWIFARYFDLFDSLAARGFAFLLLGGALFAEGFWYRKRKVEISRRAPA